MRPKSKKKDAASEVLPKPQTETTKPKAQPEEQEPEASKVSPSERISITFFTDENGKIDFSRMRESMKERIKETLPELNQQFAVGSPTAQTGISVIPPEWIGTLFDGIGRLEAMIFTKTMELDPEIAQTVFVFNEAEKAQLVPPASAVLNKRAPEWMLKYKDEFGLLMLITMMTISKIQIAKAMNEMQKTVPARPSVVPTPIQSAPSVARQGVANNSNGETSLTPLATEERKEKEPA